MLTNNFRPLLSFYSGSSFKDVMGNNVPKVEFLGGNSLNGRTTVYDTDDYTAWNMSSGNRTWANNNHEYRGSTLNYNYNATTGTNSFTQEKTKYNWRGVVSKGEVTSGNTDAANGIFNGFVLFVGDNNDDQSLIGEEAASTDWQLRHSVELAVTDASCIHTSFEKTYVSRTFENNTQEDVAISEIGCYVFKCKFCNGAEVNNPSSYIVMIGRKILNTPVIIPVGEQRTFTYIIDMSKISFGNADGV